MEETKSNSDFSHTLAAIVERLKPALHEEADVATVQRLEKLIHSMFATSYFGLSYADENNPDFWPIFNQAFNVLAPNPDDVYLIAPISEKGTYCISGFRGTVHVLDFQVGNSPLVRDGQMPFGATLANFDLDTIEQADDGAFEVIISAQKPSDYSGDWWQLPPSSNYILARLRSYDWSTEVDGRLAIERIDIKCQTTTTRPINPDKMAAWIESWARFSISFVNRYIENQWFNRVEVSDLTQVGGFSRQYYVEGIFQLESDEALIYETEVPESRYWNIQLTDMMWVTLDYLNYNTSINGHSAILDADGKFRAVISAIDPGVTNWLDTTGLRQGVIFGRWLEAEKLPTATVTKVKLVDILDYLPANTAQVSVAQREEIMKRKRRNAQLRRRW